MDNLRGDDRHTRQVANIVHSVYLKFFLVGLAVGVVLLVGGEIASQDHFNLTVRRIGFWVSRGGLCLAAGCFPLALISWFERETTKHPGFQEQRLPQRYRAIAWSVVLVSVVLFVAALWFTLSRGLTTWR